MQKIDLPLTKSARKKLKAGERVLLSGKVYTARDVAHKRLVEIIKKNKKPPIPLKDEIIYYTGPTPARPGQAIGSCGPTTSSRMDRFTLPLLKKGLAAMIGKGSRSADIRRAVRRFGVLYFITVGGAGAFLSKRIKRAKAICFRDLGPEAIYELEVKDFPVIVAVDSRGRSVYERRRSVK